MVPGLELRSKRVLPPVSRGIENDMTPPQPAPVICSGSLRQHDPPSFTGSDDIDAEDWLSTFERVSTHNRWDDVAKLNNVSFCLDKLAESWFHNNEPKMQTWSAFKTRFLAAFGRPALRKLNAEQRLRVRAQQDNESYTSYIEDIVDLCKRVDPAMPESEKVRHVLKGIEEFAFQMLLNKNPQTVDEITTWCLSYDELRKQRVVTRQRTSPHEECSRGCLSSLTMPHDLSSLLPHIEEFVRAQIARQLALLPSVHERLPSPSLPSTVRRVLREQVAEVLPPVRQPTLVPAPVVATVAPPVAPPFEPQVTVPLEQPVAAPIAPPMTMAVPPAIPGALPFSYASVVQQLQPGAFQAYQYVRDPRATPYPRLPPEPLNPWRTSDNRPICYACCMPGHVARLCRRRPPPASDVHRVPPYGSQSYYTHGDLGQAPNSSSADRPPFSSRRSFSPRRRSPSPMRPRQNPTAEGN